MRRMGRFWSRVDGTAGKDGCWWWKGDFFYDHKLKRWYPVIPWGGNWVRVDLLSYRMGQKQNDGILATGRVRPANVRPRCRQLNCVNPRHMEEIKTARPKSI